jgi:hypothetical protein
MAVATPLPGLSAPKPRVPPIAVIAAPHITASADQALYASAMIMAMSLLLQRFGLPFGGQSISVVGPLGLLVFAIFLLRGTLAFDRNRVILYVALLTCAVLGVAWRGTGLGWTGGGASTNSLLQFLILTSVATLTFAEPVDETRFFYIINQLFMLVALAGLLQFAAQFAGLRLFSFTGVLPDAVLFEQNYNLVIPVGIGELLKSNGFFLVEPSVFSQLMALALIIELLLLRRPLYFAAFAAGLMLSFSGTGWIVIAAFVVTAPLGMGRRGLVLAVIVVVLLFALGLLAAVLAPDMIAVFQARLGEISTPGTSGHLRFITPFWLLSDIFAATPSATLLGIGSGAAERLTMPYEYTVNTPIKIALEYGVPALVAYVLLFVVARRTALQSALALPAIVLFLFTGGYQQFPPMIFMVLLLISIARLTPSPR